MIGGMDILLTNRSTDLPVLIPISTIRRVEDITYKPMIERTPRSQQWVPTPLDQLTPWQTLWAGITKKRPGRYITTESVTLYGEQEIVARISFHGDDPYSPLIVKELSEEIYRMIGL